MADNTTIHNESLLLPEDIWETIAGFLDNDDLARFKQLCKVTQFVGSNAVILQPLYNRLYALDETLPPILPQEDPFSAFKKAFKKIQANHQFEIDYLTGHHCDTLKKPEYVRVFQESSTVSLQSLEARNTILDKINSEIITAKIDVNSASLDLNNIGITRLPVTLFQDPTYAKFWQNLTHLTCKNNRLTKLNVQELLTLQELYCTNNKLTILKVQGLVTLQKLECGKNKLTVLNVQGLTGLQRLSCFKNKLIELNVQGLVGLQDLYCCNNQLTIMDLQGLAELKWFHCDFNPLKTLLLTGVHANTQNKYAYQERSLLFKELGETESPQAKQAIISRLGDYYTFENCLKYCPIYATKLFPFISTNSPLSQASTFLPSFSVGTNNNVTESTTLKRKRDEEAIGIKALSEDFDNQPALKKSKKK